MRDEARSCQRDGRGDDAPWQWASDEATLPNVPLGEIQDEHDDVDRDGTHRHCRKGDGETHGTRHAPEVFLRSSTLNSDHSLLAAWKVSLCPTATVSASRDVDSLPTDAA